MGNGGREVAEKKLIRRGLLRSGERTGANVDEERNGSVGCSLLGHLECMEQVHIWQKTSPPQRHSKRGDDSATRLPKAMPMNRFCTPLVVVVSYTRGSGYFVVCIVSQVWSKAIPCIPMPSQYVNLCSRWLVGLVIFTWFNKIPILVVQKKKSPKRDFVS